MIADIEGVDTSDALRRDRYGELPDMTYAQWEAPKRGEGYLQKKGLTSTVGNGILQSSKLPDILIGKSLGAKRHEYRIKDLLTGKEYDLADGSRLQNVEVFAGKKTSTPYRNAYKYAKPFGGEPEDWQHVKAIGVVATEDGDRPAEIHWSQCEGHGKHDYFIKRWLDES